MLGTMRHHESYASGMWANESLGVYVGWTVRKGSFSDGMPLFNEQRDQVLVFSGEEYPRPDTGQTLKHQGHSFDPDGPSYLIHLAEEQADFPNSLNGHFHGIHLDLIRREARLFNDRFGMHRLYYSETPEAFYFGAEAKALLEVLPDSRSCDTKGLGEFISCGCVLENRTLFKGVYALPPASSWKFRDGKLERRDAYFNPTEWEQQERLDSEGFYNELRRVFSENLPRYFGGREQVAVSLTGGLDTRMIMAWWKAEPHSLPSYTFGGSYRDCQDVKIARKVAQICGQQHEVIPVGESFLHQFPKYAERSVYLSDGCTMVNRGADLYANEIAATIAPVRMTGNYGSEVLRRVPAFKPARLNDALFQPELMESAAEASKTYRGQIEGHAVTFVAFRQAPWYQHGLLSLEETQVAMRSPFLDNDLVRVAYRAPDSSIAKSDIFEDNEACSRLIADGNPELHRLRTDRGLAGDDGGWTSALTRAALEFTFRAEYAYDYGMPAWLSRTDHMLKPLHLERLFLGRHKFCHFRVWYRDSLAEYVREMLLDSRTLARPFLKRDQVESIVTHHLRGDRNYTTEITRLLTLELLHRLFLDAR